jgi:transketolase
MRQQGKLSDICADIDNCFHNTKRQQHRPMLMTRSDTVAKGVPEGRCPQAMHGLRRLVQERVNISLQCFGPRSAQRRPLVA